LNLDELIKNCIRQNRKAQEELYHLYKKPLFVLSLKYCQNEAQAEDNLHDAFIEIYANIKNYKGNGSFEGWIKRIAINKAIAKFRSSLNDKPLDAIIYPVLDEEVEIDSDGLSLDFLLQLIQELPNQYRLVFNLYELDDYSHKEIAAMLSISEGTSKSNLHKAKMILKNKIVEVKPLKRKNGI
jgi:RNA polymerase sigma factor (sigma-70 family)